MSRFFQNPVGSTLRYQSYSGEKVPPAVMKLKMPLPAPKSSDGDAIGNCETTEEAIASHKADSGRSQPTFKCASRKLLDGMELSPGTAFCENLFGQPEVEFIVDVDVLFAVQKHPLNARSGPLTRSDQIRPDHIDVPVVVKKSRNVLTSQLVLAILHVFANESCREGIRLRVEKATDTTIDQIRVPDRRGRLKEDKGFGRYLRQCMLEDAQRRRRIGGQCGGSVEHLHIHLTGHFGDFGVFRRDNVAIQQLGRARRLDRPGEEGPAGDRLEVLPRDPFAPAASRCDTQDHGAPTEEPLTRRMAPARPRGRFLGVRPD